MSNPKAKQTLGLGGLNTYTGEIRADEFLRELKGRKAIKKFREMRDNDSTIGAVMYAVEQMLRDVKYEVNPSDDSPEAARYANFVEEVLSDMDHTLDDHISEAISYLTYGFSTFEVVYKRRVGPLQRDPKKRSKYTDGHLGVRKIASRSQWTVEKFIMDPQEGEVLGIQQTKNFSSTLNNVIPAWKLLHYKTTTTNEDPSGRSVLRNAYSSYTFLNNLQTIEAIAVERELHGVPIARIPAEYLSDDATEERVALRNRVEQMLRDLKLNEQGYMILPSDVYTDVDGKPTDQRLMDVELISSNGSRNIDIDPIIKRYQFNIAMSLMAEFLTMGDSDRGSYAMSKTKTDTFLKSLESYINTIYDVINKQLLERLWELNNFPFEYLPKIVPGDVAPHDLRELGSFLRNLNGADISLSNQVDIIDSLLDSAELPRVDRDTYIPVDPNPKKTPEETPEGNPNG